MSSNILFLNPFQTEFLIFVYHNDHIPFIYITILYSHLLILLAIFVSSLIKIWSFAEHIPAVSKSCFHKIRDLRRIRDTIDQTTTCTIATSFVHCNIDNCTSLLLNLPAIQMNHLQLPNGSLQFALNSAARANS